MKKAIILFIDDEIVLASKIKQILELEDYFVQYESSAIIALDYLKENIPDLIICDIWPYHSYYISQVALHHTIIHF